MSYYTTLPLQALNCTLPNRHCGLDPQSSLSSLRDLPHNISIRHCGLRAAISTSTSVIEIAGQARNDGYSRSLSLSECG